MNMFNNHAYKISDNKLRIVDSYDVKKCDFDIFLDGIKLNEENIGNSSKVWERSRFSLKTEWACHNFLYNIGFKRNRTKDVDLNFPQKLYEKIIYPIAGVIFWVFIK